MYAKLYSERRLAVQCGNISGDDDARGRDNTSASVSRYNRAIDTMRCGERDSSRREDIRDNEESRQWEA